MMIKNRETRVNGCKIESYLSWGNPRSTAGRSGSVNGWSHENIQIIRITRITRITGLVLQGSILAFLELSVIEVRLRNNLQSKTERLGSRSSHSGSLSSDSSEFTRILVNLQENMFWESKSSPRYLENISYCANGFSLSGRCRLVGVPGAAGAQSSPFWSIRNLQENYRNYKNRSVTSPRFFLAQNPNLTTSGYVLRMVSKLFRGRS